MLVFDQLSICLSCFTLFLMILVLMKCQYFHSKPASGPAFGPGEKIISIFIFTRFGGASKGIRGV